MKFKLAVPRDVLTPHQINLIEASLRSGLPEVVVANFPNWKKRFERGDIAGGEIILQDTDYTQPIKGLKPGIHVTISMVSFQPERDFDGLAAGVISLIKGTKSEDVDHELFMLSIGVYAQMSLNKLVSKMVGTGRYKASPDGENLLEYSG